MRHLLLSLMLSGPIASSLAAQTPAFPPAAQDSVIASGEGVVKRAPDQVLVTVASEARSRQPRDAQSQNAKVAAAIRARLAAFALPDGAVRTLSVDLQPQWDWADGKQTLRGYLAINMIEVRLDDVGRVGEVIDAVIAAGATRVSDVRFTLKDMAGAEQQALKLASSTALARARAMADGVGRVVERVFRLDETGGSQPSPPPPMMVRAMAADSAGVPSTPVTAGDIEVRVTVTLHAALK